MGLLTVAAFFPVLHNGFVDWDDDVNIVDNLNYRGLGWQQLRWMFTNLDMGHYQPLSWLTLGLDYVLWGMNPFGYHLINLILHGASAAIFYFVALRLLATAFRKSSPSEELPFRVAAAFAALLFSLHPLRVESVAWVTERRGLLAGLFFLLSVLCYLRANDILVGNAPRLRWLAAAVTTYGLSLLSKASALGLPIVLLALDVYPLARLSGEVREWLGSEKRKVWWEKLPFLVLALAALVGAFLAEYQRGAMRSLQEFGIISRIGQAFFGLTFYLWKTLVPSGFLPVYSVVADSIPAYWSFQPMEEMVLALSIIISLTITILLFLFRRRWPAGLAAWVCYVAMLAPVLGFVRIAGQIAADRYSYLSCLGWPILAAGGAIYFCRLWTAGRIGFGRFVLAAPLSVAVLVGLGILTWRQTQVWHDSETLFGHVLNVAPRSKMAHVQLGYVLASQGELDEAVKHYRLALQVDPDYPIALFDLGDALSQQGKLDEALQHYRHVIRLSPGFVITYQRLGNLLAQQGKLEEAADSYRRAIEMSPNFDVAHNNLGLVLAAQGKLDEATQHYRKALDLNPEFALAHVNFGDALVLRGTVDEAIGHFRKALEIEPGLVVAHYSLGRALARKGLLAEASGEYMAVKSDSTIAVAYYDLGNAYFRRGEYRQAAEQYRQSVKINPDYAVAYFSLGNALSKMGQAQAAIEQYRQAVKHDGEYAEAYSNLGTALEAEGKLEEAIRAYRRAIELKPRYAPARYNLGNALVTRGEVEAAIEAYRSAIQIDPRHAPAHFNLGLLLGEQRDVDGAIGQFRSVIELEPKDAEAHYQLGRFLAHTGKVDEAAREFREALRIEPGFAQAKQSLKQLGAEME